MEQAAEAAAEAAMLTDGCTADPQQQEEGADRCPGEQRQGGQRQEGQRRQQHQEEKRQQVKRRQVDAREKRRYAAAKARLHAHREHFELTVVEAKIWRHHPWHTYCAVSIVPGPIEPTFTSILCGTGPHPVWGAQHGATESTVGDIAAQCGETLRFECGAAFRAGIVYVANLPIVKLKHWANLPYYRLLCTLLTICLPQT